jgi:hypothetical protein
MFAREGGVYGLLHGFARITTNHVHGRMPPWVPGRDDWRLDKDEINSMDAYM